MAANVIINKKSQGEQNVTPQRQQGQSVRKKASETYRHHSTINHIYLNMTVDISVAPVPPLYVEWYFLQVDPSVVVRPSFYLLSLKGGLS
jgi:hypothetical protein